MMNGHGACANYCIRIKRKCWCCSEPIGDLRNRQLETVLSAMVTTRKFKRYGCGETAKVPYGLYNAPTCTGAWNGFACKTVHAG
ncbi:hypothetical protein ACP70R_030362 [Stipagrostis hirtigluma subsp. patula]